MDTILHWIGFVKNIYLYIAVAAVIFIALADSMPIKRFVNKFAEMKKMLRNKSK
jgi:hypothetical protein